MSHLQRIILTLAIIFVSLALGWLMRRAAELGWLHMSETVLDKCRNILQTASIFVFMPLSAMLSLWGLPHPKPELMILPLLGLASYISGGALALAAGRLVKLDRSATGSFFCCGTFTNIGAVGGLVCLLFLGENSIALVALYRLVEELYYFSIAFPIARWFGPDNKNKALNFRAVRVNPALLAVIGGLLLGICLNLGSVPRPDFCGPLASAAMLAATVFLLFAIGLTLRFSRLWGYISPSLVMCVIKFAGIPIVVIPLAWMLGLGKLENGLPLQVSAILCSMPVAMTALVPPALFKLDLDLANACWVFSTIGLIVELPILLLLLPML